jgi:hypothetical protein
MRRYATFRGMVVRAQVLIRPGGETKGASHLPARTVSPPYPTPYVQKPGHDFCGEASASKAVVVWVAALARPFLIQRPVG